MRPSALLLKGCQKKQDNHTAIFNKFSMEAANIAFKAFMALRYFPWL